MRRASRGSGGRQDVDKVYTGLTAVLIGVVCLAVFFSRHGLSDWRFDVPSDSLPLPAGVACLAAGAVYLVQAMTGGKNRDDPPKGEG
jgi:hypothetical protein